MTESLLSRRSPLADGHTQLQILDGGSERLRALARFHEKLKASGIARLVPTTIEIFQINLGKMCNQTCRHCHVDAGPDRREIMTRETMALCLDALRHSTIATVDLTGGAPEMNPNFRWLVEELSKIGRTIIDRCNLTILVANDAYRDLPAFFARHHVKVISSLPYFQQGFTDRQRGDGVFKKSIEALHALNGLGYGVPGSGLELDLVYNPAGAFLPAPQPALEADFKRELKKQFDVIFNRLYTITNMPISRFLDFLQVSGNLDAYMEKLVNSYNPAAATGVMCRNTLSVGWDGRLYDCDFNQMLDLPVAATAPQHVRDFHAGALGERAIQIGQHCFGCTAGAGSSCGGSIV